MCGAWRAWRSTKTACHRLGHCRGTQGQAPGAGRERGAAAGAGHPGHRAAGGPREPQALAEGAARGVHESFARLSPARAQRRAAARVAGRGQEPRLQVRRRRLAAAPVSHGLRRPVPEVPRRDREEHPRGAGDRQRHAALRAVDGRDREGHRRRQGRRLRRRRVAPRAGDAAHLDERPRIARVPGGHRERGLAAAPPSCSGKAASTRFSSSTCRRRRAGRISSGFTWRRTSRTRRPSTSRAWRRRARASPGRRSNRPSSPRCTRCTPRKNRWIPARRNGK